GQLGHHRVEGLPVAGPGAREQPGLPGRAPGSKIPLRLIWHGRLIPPRRRRRPARGLAGRGRPVARAGVVPHAHLLTRGRLVLSRRHADASNAAIAVRARPTAMALSLLSKGNGEWSAVATLYSSAAIRPAAAPAENDVPLQTANPAEKSSLSMPW